MFSESVQTTADSITHRIKPGFENRQCSCLCYVTWQASPRRDRSRREKILPNVCAEFLSLSVVCTAEYLLMHSGVSDKLNSSGRTASRGWFMRLDRCATPLPVTSSQSVTTRAERGPPENAPPPPPPPPTSGAVKSAGRNPSAGRKKTLPSPFRPGVIFL